MKKYILFGVLSVVTPSLALAAGAEASLSDQDVKAAIDNFSKREEILKAQQRVVNIEYDIAQKRAEMKALENPDQSLESQEMGQEALYNQLRNQLDLGIEGSGSGAYSESSSSTIYMVESMGYNGSYEAKIVIDERVITVKEGDRIPGGYSVSKITKDSMLLSSGGDEKLIGITPLSQVMGTESGSTGNNDLMYPPAPAPVSQPIYQ